MYAVIVDDEPHAVKNLESLLGKYMPHVQVVATATSVSRALMLVNGISPDVLFLDIKMQGETGFDLLSELGDYNGSIIFVTAYEEYSLKALKAGALDYLLKPIDIEELQAAVNKAAERLQKKAIRLHEEQLPERYRIAATAMKHPSKLRCITISGQQGFEIVPVNDIVFIEADGNYSIVYLTNLQKIVATRQMGEFEELLSGNGFFRIHKSAIINLQHLRSYDSREGHVARMTDGSSVAISGRRLSDFMKAVDQYAKEV